MSEAEKVAAGEVQIGGADHAFQPDAEDWYCLSCGMPRAGHGPYFAAQPERNQP